MNPYIGELNNARKHILSMYRWAVQKARVAEDEEHSGPYYRATAHTYKMVLGDLRRARKAMEVVESIYGEEEETWTTK